MLTRGAGLIPGLDGSEGISKLIEQSSSKVQVLKKGFLMIRVARWIGIGVFLSMSGASFGESLHGVQPLDTLGGIKKRFPNAEFTVVEAAWVTEGEAFFKMQGQGFPGTLYLAFEDGRPSWKRFQEEQEALPENEVSVRNAKFAAEMAGQDDDVALSYKWARWVPVQPIPFERYKSKYGEPDDCGFATSDMSPYCRWSARNLVTHLSDDKKLVFGVEARATLSELKQAYMSRDGVVPSWLANLPEVKPKISTQAKKPTR